MTRIFGAVDLGASSGRVVAGIIGSERFELIELHRFENVPVENSGGLFWNFDELFFQVCVGIQKLGAYADQRSLPVESIGIDTWAVDFGLISADGRLIAQPRHYRDQRNQLGVADIHSRVSPADLFAINGLQHQPFNTIFQLAAFGLQDAQTFEKIDKVLLLPDLIAYLLTGNAVCEVTNASTTGLLDAKQKSWSQPLLDLVGLSADNFGPLVQPGHTIGTLKPEFANIAALKQTRVIAVASHDTASAIVGTPLPSARSAYLSSGTWSLLGVELETPVLSETARASNFTNELGASNRVRFLKNLSGLWLLNQCIETWSKQDSITPNLASLLTQAADAKSTGVFDVTDQDFFAPGDVAARIQVALHRAGSRVPQTRGELVRAILESLAQSYAQTIEELQLVTGEEIETINVVGGGSANALLCQLTADASGLPVLAGPTEATAIGNLLIQAMAAGEVAPNLVAARQITSSAFPTRQYLPTPANIENTQHREATL